MGEDERARAAREHALRNIDTIFEILVSGSDDDVEELRQFHGKSPEAIGTARHYARLRSQAHDDAVRETEERERTRPVPTADEWELGCFAEQLEPQVRDAVFALREKGYTTVASGFHGIGESQHVLFAEPIDASLVPASLIDALAARGIRLWLNDRSDTLSFASDRPLSAHDLRATWKEITDALPRLGEATRSELPVATIFRTKYPINP